MYSINLMYGVLRQKFETILYLELVTAEIELGLVWVKFWPVNSHEDYQLRFDSVGDLGGYIVMAEKLPHYVVPDLTGFKVSLPVHGGVFVSRPERELGLIRVDSVKQDAREEGYSGRTGRAEEATGRIIKSNETLTVGPETTRSELGPLCYANSAEFIQVSAEMASEGSIK
ncbi:hypothetical protein FCM35_KLT05988 [Carex littledalei]|uniref:Uncharacterized protein n=1 Tax=Carex littledalei TaxID=544730 RepID=A0A833QLI9_9POAL|nr:hypothetical protein FCM35_KLT05988 [Carex littledalei]